MKKLILILSLISAAVSLADIQAPPASHQTRIHKLGRGVSNVAYGVTELPFTMMKVNRREGNNAAFGNGVVEGLQRSLRRVGVGLFEIATFPVRTYKDSFRSPLQNIEYDPYNGYSEFAPELGWQSNYQYARKQPL